MKKNYVRPSMVKIGNPLFSKHGSGPQVFRKFRSTIENHSIRELTQQFGSPLYVFSESVMREQYKNLHVEVSKHYSNFRFGWSYKTNYLKGVCQVFHDLGAMAEVVSEFEYEKAIRLGIPTQEIIYNGPNKTRKSLEQAVLGKSIINVDNLTELEIIDSIAREHSVVANIGIRINFNTGTHIQWSRFGFNLETGQAWNAYQRIAASEHLKIIGLHCHIGTFVLDTNAYKRAATCMLQFMKQIEAAEQRPLQYLDLGGGFPSQSRLKGVYQPPEIAIPSIGSFVKAMFEPLEELKSRIHPPAIYLENGRYMVDEAGFLLTSVVADKILPDGKRSYIIDAGVNLLYTSTWYRFQIELERDISGPLSPAILHGPLCMNIDVVDEGIMLPPLSRDDLLCISPVGAYNLTQSMQFISYRPAVVMVRASGEIIVLKAAEDLDAVEALEKGLDDASELRKLA